MPYSHLWAYHPIDWEWAAVWPAVITDTTRIVDRVTQLGIALTGPDGHHDPVISVTDGIAFSGGATGVPLRLLAPHRNPYPSPCGTPAATVGTCDTGREPYDLAVSAVLLRCKLLLGDTFLIGSDGGWDLEWLCGVRVGQPSPRHLITELFEALPTNSPLHRPSLAR
jgi:hypothetical protein